MPYCIIPRTDDDKHYEPKFLAVFLQTICISSTFGTFPLEVNSCQNYQNINVAYRFFKAATAFILDVHFVVGGPFDLGGPWTVPRNMVIRHYVYDNSVSN